MSTADLTTVALILCLGAAVFGLLIREQWRVSRTPNHQRSFQRRCPNCRQIIWWRQGMADKAADRLRDHQKECLS